MKTFYHNDADGKCAAALIRIDKEKQGITYNEFDFIEMDYNKKFPVDIVGEGEEVWIVDFSIKPEEMRSLLSVTNNVTWIDHHSSAIEAYDKDGNGGNGWGMVKGIRSVSMSGCELVRGYIGGAWTDAHNVQLDRYEDHSMFFDVVDLIGDRDTWTFNYGDISRHMDVAFHIAGDPGPMEQWWSNIISDPSELKHSIISGAAAFLYQKSLYETWCDRWAYEAMFEGHKILVCNTNVFTSELFGDRVKDYPFVCVYCHNGESFKFSLYSANMDVVEYAVKHGGGGHPRACGFVSKEIPFKKIAEK